MHMVFMPDQRPRTSCDSVLHLSMKRNPLPASFDQCKYVVTSNHRDLSVPTTEYWGHFLDLIRRDDAGQLRIYSLSEFLLRVLFEFRIQTHDGDAHQHYRVYVAHSMFGTFSHMPRDEQAFRHALRTYEHAWRRNPVQQAVLQFHLQFASKPARYHTPGPTTAVIDHLLYRLCHNDMIRYEDPAIEDLGSEYAGSEVSSGPETPTALRRKPSKSSDVVAPWPRNVSLSHFLPAGASTNGPKRSFIPQDPRTFGENISSIRRRVGLLVSPTSRAHRDSSAILESLGAEIKLGGIHNLDGWLPVTATPSLREFETCCSIFPHLNAEELAYDAKARTIRFPHSKLHVTPPQFYSAYRMLEGTGGFLGHDMGLGKTHTVLAAVALKCLVAASKRRCVSDWGSPFSHRHLPRALVPAGNMQCPSQRERPGDVLCYCVPTGVTRRIADVLKPGATLIQVPVSTMTSWAKAIESAEFKPSPYEFVIVSTSSDIPAHLKRNLIAFKTQGAFRMGATTDKKVVGDSFDLAWTSHATLESAGSYVFLTSHFDDSFFKTFSHRPCDLRPRPPPDCVFSRETVYGAPIALTFVDEAHLPRVSDRKYYPMVMAMCHKWSLGADTWFVSGTPFSPSGLEQLMFPLQLINWGKPNFNDRLGRLSGLYSDATYKGVRTHINKFRAEFDKFFTPEIVVRFLHNSSFFGQPVSSIQNIQPTVVSRPTPRSYADHVRTLATKCKGLVPSHLGYADSLAKAPQQVHDELYFVSVFPAAAKYINEHRLGVGDAQMRIAVKSLEDRTQVMDIPEVQQFWRHVGKNSPKIKLIIAAIDRANADQRPRPPLPVDAKRSRTREPDNNLLLKKIVILAPTVASAIYLFMWLKFEPTLQLKNINPVLYHEDLSRGQRMRIEDDFNSLDRNRPGTRTARTLVGTMAAAATGMNLQIANYQILTSPASSATHQAQAFARTNRTGQSLPVHHTVLVLDDSPIDRINMASLAQREIGSDPYKVSEALELKPEDDGTRSQEDLYKILDDVPYALRQAALAGGDQDPTANPMAGGMWI